MIKNKKVPTIMFRNKLSQNSMAYSISSHAHGSSVWLKVNTCRLCSKAQAEGTEATQENIFSRQLQKYKHTSFYCPLQILCFLLIEGLYQPDIEQVYHCHFFNSIYSLCVSLHILVILAAFKTFSLFLYLLWWSVNFDVNITEGRLRWWSALFSWKNLIF